MDSATSKSVKGATVAKEEPKTYCTRITQYGWDQSEKFVKIYISNLPGLNELKQENVKHSFKQKSFEIELENVSKRSYSLCISDLMASIVPEECSVKVKSDMVVVSVRKAHKGEWACLTGTEKKLKDSKESKASKVDKDEDPGVSIMNLMKQMYADGDDEMKRTISKAWHESQTKRVNVDV
ncbi:hypothetical protein EMCRGX_G020576 [Ephydatia muelleri]|eukprot:Em0016g544a